MFCYIIFYSIHNLLRYVLTYRYLGILSTLLDRSLTIVGVQQGFLSPRKIIRQTSTIWRWDEQAQDPRISNLGQWFFSTWAGGLSKSWIDSAHPRDSRNSFGAAPLCYYFKTKSISIEYVVKALVMFFDREFAKAVLQVRSWSHHFSGLEITDFEQKKVSTYLRNKTNLN